MSEVENKGIGKLGVGLIICVTLVGLLAVSNIWFYVHNIDIQSRVSSLEAETNDLQSQMSSLTSQRNSLTTEKNSLQNQVDDLTTENTRLEDEIDWLNYKYDTYVASHQYADWEYEEIQFYFYYILPEEQKFGVYDLDDELYGLEWIEPYQEGVFDCSEMSAYLEWHLENEGWHAIIILGDSPFGSGRHAWLLVETSEGKYMPVEPTTIEIVWWEDPYFDNYWIYDYEFEEILDALDYSETEFDWWI